MVQDLYNPKLQNTNIGDSLSDNFLGTNNTAIKNMYNQLETSKAMTINKYAWNKEGMLKSGINPLISSQNLSSVSSGAPSNMSSSNDIFSRVINKLFTTIDKRIDSIDPTRAIDLLTKIM